METLPDILAFMSLSYTVLKLWVETGRTEHHNVLPEPHLYRDSIRDAEGRQLFAALVNDSMWELDQPSRENLYGEPTLRG